MAALRLPRIKTPPAAMPMRRPAPGAAVQQPMRSPQAPMANPPSAQGWQRKWFWGDSGSQPMGQPRLGLARLMP